MSSLENSARCLFVIENQPVEARRCLFVIEGETQAKARCLFVVENEPVEAKRCLFVVENRPVEAKRCLFVIEEPKQAKARCLFVVENQPVEAKRCLFVVEDQKQAKARCLFVMENQPVEAKRCLFVVENHPAEARRCLFVIEGETQAKARCLFVVENEPVEAKRCLFVIENAVEQGQLDKVSAYYEHLKAWDVSQVKARLVAKGIFRADEVDAAEREYKRFMALGCAYGSNAISERVDEFWHAHILFTEDYAAMCKSILGKFIHHRPESLDAPDPSADELANYCASFGPPDAKWWGKAGVTLN